MTTSKWLFARASAQGVDHGPYYPHKPVDGTDDSRLNPTTMNDHARPLPAALAKRATALSKQKKERLAKAARDWVSVVKRKRREIAGAFYEIGRALVELSKEEHYRAMGYDKFDALLEHELQMSAAQAQRLQACAERLDEGQATELGYEKSMAVTQALALPGTSFDGAKLLIGKRAIDTESASARDIETITISARRARQKPGKPTRGKTTNPLERKDAARCQAELRRAGAKSAEVSVVATKPGRPADIVIRLSAADVGSLAKVRWADKFSGA